MAIIEINRNPSAKDLRWFGVLLAVFAGLVGTLSWWRDATTAATVIWSVGLAMAALYYAWPAARRPIFLGWMYLAYPIGWVMSHVILAVIFFLVITPIGLLMRALGRDPMNRRFDPSTTSYWEPRDKTTGTDRYFRQF